MTHNVIFNSSKQAETFANHSRWRMRMHCTLVSTGTLTLGTMQACVGCSTSYQPSSLRKQVAGVTYRACFFADK